MVKLNKLYLVLIFIIFAFIRFFVDFKYYIINGDLLRYLTTAKYFPYHLYLNKSLFIFHPPLFPYFINIFNFIVSKDYIAAILVSFFFSLISFIVLVKLFYLLKKNTSWICVFMLFFAFNLRHAYFSMQIMKTSMIFALFWLTIYFFIKGLKKSNFNFIYSGIFSAMLVLTTDLAITIFPIFILTFIFFYNGKKKKKIISALFSFLSALIAYLFWILLKLKIYLNNVYYPIIDGFIEKVNHFNILQLYNPAFFPLVKSFSAFYPVLTITIFIKHIRYFFRQFLNIVSPFDMPVISPSLFGLREYLLLIFVYLPIIFFISITIIKTIINLKKFKIYNNLNLYFILISIIILIPIIQTGSVPRYSMPFIVPLFFFITEGIFIFIRNFQRKFLCARNSFGISKHLNKIKFLPIIIILLLIFFLPYWIIKNPYPITSLESETMGSAAIEYINNLDGDVIMSFTVPVAYFTDKREISLYPIPEKLDFFIKLYNVTYIAININKNDYTVWAHKKTIDYISNHPEKYKLLIEKEHYSDKNHELMDNLINTEGKFYIYLVK